MFFSDTYWTAETCRSNNKLWSIGTFSSLLVHVCDKKRKALVVSCKILFLSLYHSLFICYYTILSCNPNKSWQKFFSFYMPQLWEKASFTSVFPNTLPMKLTVFAVNLVKFFIQPPRTPPLRIQDVIQQSRTSFKKIVHAIWRFSTVPLGSAVSVPTIDLNF